MDKQSDLTEFEFNELREKFQKFDTNGDGAIDVNELSEVMKLIGETHKQESLRKMINTADSDGDGKMSFEEFVALVQKTKSSKVKSALVDAINMASQIHVPTKYVRLQNTRMVFNTSDRDIVGQTKEEEEDTSVVFAVRASWLVNVTLLIMKIICYKISGSKAVLAALADSVVDLVSQLILAAGDYYANKPSSKYPIGRSRIESLSVLGCAAVMIVANIEVMQDAAGEIYHGAQGIIPVIPPGDIVYIILGIGVAMKFALYIYCTIANKGPDGKTKSDMLGALAEDHLNDVFSNVAACVTMAISQNTIAWWVDPVGCIAISLIIVQRWWDIMKDQMEKITGATASPEFLENIRNMIINSNKSISDVDRVIAYFSGARYNIEADILLPKTMPVDTAHDIALQVQDLLEALPDVERANIHIDFKKRDGLEHKVERDLAKKVTSSSHLVVAPSHESFSNESRNTNSNPLLAKSNLDAPLLKGGSLDIV